VNLLILRVLFLKVIKKCFEAAKLKSDLEKYLESFYLFQVLKTL
jgi:hypothetical protein